LPCVRKVFTGASLPGGRALAIVGNPELLIVPIREFILLILPQIINVVIVVPTRARDNDIAVRKQAVCP
jgi:hypothetical protein